MNRSAIAGAALAACALCGPGQARAQEAGLSISVGVRAWYTDWSTFSYFAPDGVNNLALTQVSANEKFAWLPLISVRYGDFFASFSGMPSTDFHFVEGGTGTRKEYDLNIGYAVLPGLALTLGYKKVSQGDGDAVYRPAGPVIGVNLNAPMSGPWSLYGAVGLGWLKTPGGDDIQFDADYRLAELGLAYTIDGGAWIKSWTFTGGYRIQVLTSKDAFNAQDGRDTTQGFTLGAIASF
ncbi:hypothetical protein [Caldimonas sp. KR1-144]|uniref:hypothetical protein n=1 Tax=Caldimonas sp. KR1-144 TaxID=3400911 RepID=UPI003C085227